MFWSLCFGAYVLGKSESTNTMLRDGL